MPVTMKDVAERAGVSAKTVSNVINGHRYISSSTRTAVMDAVAELGYQVNVSARNLRVGRTNMIMLAVPDLTQTYFAEIAALVIHEADRHGLKVLVEQTDAKRQREVDVLAGFQRNLTDGLIFSPLGLGPGDTALFNVSFPMVLLGNRVSETGDAVLMRDEAAAHAATAHLLAGGARRIAAIGSDPDESNGSAELRLQGYRRALDEAGVPFDDGLVVVTNRWHRSNGAAGATELLRRDVPFDGLFAFNDLLALGAMHELQSRGVRVPEDVAVIGYDDIDEGRYSSPTLSTVSPGMEDVARMAVDLLVERIETPAHDGGATQRYSEFRVVERESTRPVG
ncbi:LacI family DNA-binding transcriptional regulator [Curtobacterium sp. MCBD17_040]|uniref:LacI family DNA-binding transcriptional regulator n=1 Tax=Curtobacterium sp. MCBD17_040 TaxID=2175674 RepID=UPI000DA9BCF7|nr:LacI family DNA-binding transcriptional regulator [Curtobacterium sp. MCBD17_040]WIB65547.1 LacI family DNA-binding transcriptional regulator [Curtobacterium sp. MCBD17_040]